MCNLQISEGVFSWDLGESRRLRALAGYNISKEKVARTTYQLAWAILSVEGLDVLAKAEANVSMCSVTELTLCVSPWVLLCPWDRHTHKKALKAKGRSTYLHHTASGSVGFKCQARKKKGLFK